MVAGSLQIKCKLFMNSTKSWKLEMQALIPSRVSNPQKIEVKIKLCIIHFNFGSATKIELRVGECWKWFIERFRVFFLYFLQC